MGDQWQRHAANRDHTHHHGNINKDIQREVTRDSQPHQAAELIAAAERDQHAAHDDQTQQSHHGQTADQPEFLADRGEDEIGLLLREKIKVTLGALQETLAPYSARAQRDF
jgi:hypothetical protein